MVVGQVDGVWVFGRKSVIFVLRAGPDLFAVVFVIPIFDGIGILFGL